MASDFNNSPDARKLRFRRCLFGVGLILLPLLLVAGTARADYLSAVVANATTGVATFNGTIASGNTTWVLRHADSGATPASQVQQAFTNAVGLTANYGGTFGNLTGNFTWTVTLNQTFGSGNNTTYVSETKAAAFAVTGPAPSPTPTPAPTAPPPQSSGKVRITVLSPDPDLDHRETLKVEAIVRTEGNNSTIAEVLMAKERKDPRAGQCRGVPTGWKVAALTDSSAGTYTRSWKVNDSADPLPAGTYTIYVNATASDGGWACTVVPDVRVKTEAPTAASASPDAPAKPGVNATVVATACENNPCPDGLRGPLTKGKIFYFSLSVNAKAAVCGPTECKRFDSGLKHGFTPDKDGQYCAKAIDPATDAIAQTLQLDRSYGEACWTVGNPLFAGKRLAPGLQFEIKKPEDIPCNPVPGKLESESNDDDSGSSKREWVNWRLRPGFDKTTNCRATSPVFWTVYVPATCPTALGVKEIQTAGEVPGAAKVAGSTRSGVLYSRAVNPDRTLGAWGTATSFTVPLPCTGKYEVLTMEAGDNPDKDVWTPAFAFEVNAGPGWGFWEWVAVVVAVFVGAPLGFLILSNALLSRSKTLWRPAGGVSSGIAIVGFKHDYFPAQSPRLKGREIMVLLRTKKVKRRGVGRITRYDFIGGFRDEWEAKPENVRHIATRMLYDGHGNGKGLHFIKVPMYATPGARGESLMDMSSIATSTEEFNGRVSAVDPAMLEPLANEVRDWLSDEVWKRRVRREKIRDSKLAERIRGAGAAREQVERGADDAARDAAGNLPATPSVQRPEPNPKAPPRSLF